MPNRIHKFISSESILTKLHSLIDETNRDSKERLIKICANRKVELTDSCIGGKCGVSGKKTATISCGEDSVEMARFHTHPTMDSIIMSSADITSAILSGVQTTCIGVNDEALNRIACYDYPFGLPEIKAESIGDVLDGLTRMRNKYIIEDNWKDSTTRNERIQYNRRIKNMNVQLRRLTKYIEEHNISALTKPSLEFVR